MQLFIKRSDRRFHYLDSFFRNPFLATIPFFVPASMEGNESVKDPSREDARALRRSPPLSLSFPPPLLKCARHSKELGLSISATIALFSREVEGSSALRMERMCASAYRGRDFTIVLVFPLPLFKTYFFIYYSRDDLLGRRSRDYIFQKRNSI